MSSVETTDGSETRCFQGEYLIGFIVLGEDNDGSANDVETEIQMGGHDFACQSKVASVESRELKPS